MDLSDPYSICKWLLSEGMCAVWVVDEKYQVISRHPNNDVTSMGPSITYKRLLKEEALSVHLSWLSHRYDVGEWGRVVGMPKTYFALESLKHLREKFPEVSIRKVKDTKKLRDNVEKLDTYLSKFE